jgi:hypothetical protein
MHTSKTFATVVSIATLFAIMFPVRENWREKPKDNFPLSYFPMFSHKRDSITTVNYLVGYDSFGNRWCIPYQFAGSGGFNQVRRQINKKVRNEKGEKLCEKVALKVSQCKELPYSQLVQIDLLTGAYNLDAYFMKGIKSPVHEKIISTKTIEKP